MSRHFWCLQLPWERVWRACSCLVEHEPPPLQHCREGDGVGFYKTLLVFPRALCSGVTQTLCWCSLNGWQSASYISSSYSSCSSEYVQQMHLSLWTDITHPIPDLTGYITEGQVYVDRQLHNRQVCVSQGFEPVVSHVPHFKTWKTILT